jgi:integrase/recombinase XerD
MNHEYHSNLKPYIEGLVEQKRAVGYSYKTQEFRLWQFDRFCMEHYPMEVTLTKNLTMHWAQCNDDEHMVSLESRISPVRQLAKYMSGIGVDAYIIPKGIPGKKKRYEPHIFTSQELRAFFTEADKCSYDKRSPVRHLVFPVIFRVIYCCGLRSSEARLLKVEDVDLEIGILKILNAKGKKDRTAIMSDDVLKLCCRYHKEMEKIFPGRTWFFPNHRGGCYSKCEILYMFHKFWDKTRIDSICGNPPRVHDFRHSFCVRRLNLWVAEGKDLNAFLPYLSMYLGHASLYETDYYLHLVQEFFSVITERTEGRFADLIPEVSHED